jgi:tripartite-type tricarboxylate transporter receptor subunit TctC
VNRALPFVAFCLGLMAPALSQAQGFPSGPLRMIVSDAPGTPNDVLSKVLAQPLAKLLGVPVFAENRIGANGMIGMVACGKSPPDGQTLCATGNSVISMNPAMRAKLPYDPVREFAPVVMTGFVDNCIAVHSSVAVNSMTELLNLAKAKPDAVNWGYFGEASLGYLYVNYLLKRYDAHFYPVPYKTPLQFLAALVAGEVKAGVPIWSYVVPFAKSGKMKCLAVTSSERLPGLAAVPTLEELGMRIPLRAWFGWHYQAAVPKPIIARVNSEIRKSLQEPPIKEAMASLGMLANDGTPEEYDAFCRDQIRQTMEMVKFIGIPPID